MAEGVCFCKSISFRVRDAQRGLVSYDHSKNKREWTGASFYTALLVPVDTVDIADPRGLLKTMQRQAGSSTKYFCSCCGSPIANKTANGKNYEINHGLLKPDSEAPSPMYHINCAEAIQNVLSAFSDGKPRYDKLPTGSCRGSTVSTPLATSSTPYPTSTLPNTTPKTNATIPITTSVPSVSKWGTPDSSNIKALASTLGTETPGTLLRLHTGHEVDENSKDMKDHGIISVPCDFIVELVSGDLVCGLPAPYGDYVEVSYNGKIGKVSRKVLTPVSSHPVSAVLESSHSWTTPNSSAGGLSSNFADLSVSQPPIGSSTSTGPGYGLPPQSTFAPSDPYASPQAISTNPPGGLYSSQPPMGGDFYSQQSSYTQPQPPTMQQQPPVMQQPPPAMQQQPPVMQQPPSAMQQQPPVMQQPPPTMQQQPQEFDLSPPVGNEGDFIESAQFAGAKPDYSFKSGSQGIGYYKDAAAPEPVSSSAPPGVSKGPPGVSKGPPGVSKPPPGVSKAPPGIGGRRF
eukprot:CAMPEP_0203763438 /NCGR_PEP_ID=MMETSP0098-20131031/16195_1 /ASSEMBLY_ACC=CAM_ASM_000208 /TAXON_ID=96639 /ORGANISM=" , Strain NY0313808BC1" /LENGTH=513 /DNA_ID=CAMNT_0050658263 /DNA_START=75 /DNA_END=1616 /DNA_ORIENTATION=-